MTLRVRGPAPLDVRALTTTPDPPDDWLARLVKLIPAEAIAFYTTATTRIPEGWTGDRLTNALLLAAAASAALAVVVRYFATRDEAGKPQWSAIAIALLSFALWVANLNFPDGPIAHDDFSLWLVAAASLLWVSIVPYVYRGSPQPDPASPLLDSEVAT